MGVNTLEAMANKLNYLSSDVVVVCTTLKNTITYERDIEQKIKHGEADHKKLLEQIEVQNQSMEVMKRFISLLAEEGIKTLENLLTDGLKTIFTDRNYEIEIEINDRGKTKTAEIMLIEVLISGDRRKTALRNAVGAGVQTVVSFILRIYFLMVLNMRRFLIVDEALYAVSSEYLESLHEFMRHLRDSFGFVFLIISHDPRTVPFVDHILRVKKGKISKEK